MALCRAVEMFWKGEDVYIIVHPMKGDPETWIASVNPSLTTEDRPLWFGKAADYERDIRHGMGA